MEGAGDFLGVFSSEIAQDAVFHIAEVAGVDKQELPAAIRKLAPCFLVFGQKPDTSRNLRVGKELTGERDHAFD